jgi:hypothetical protein
MLIFPADLYDRVAADERHLRAVRRSVAADRRRRSVPAAGATGPRRPARRDRVGRR